MGISEMRGPDVLFISPGARRQPHAANTVTHVSLDVLVALRTPPVRDSIQTITSLIALPALVAPQLETATVTTESSQKSLFNTISIVHLLVILVGIDKSSKKLVL